MVFRVGDTYRVQIGVFGSRTGAEEIADGLRAHNFPAEVYDKARRVKQGSEPSASSPPLARGSMVARPWEPR